MSHRRLAEVQPASFAFSNENEAWADRQIAKYPDPRQASAVLSLLWRAQKQNDYWLPKPAIEAVAAKLGMPYIRVLEVATFYTMFNLAPVGRFFIQMCGHDALCPRRLRRGQDRPGDADRSAADGDGRRQFLLARSRVPRGLLQCADGADQRRLLRRPDP